MAEKLFDNIFRIPIFLPIKDIGSVNCYVIKGPERTLIIDPGMDADICMHGLREGLKECFVDLEQCDFLVTHHHKDHCGIIKRLVNHGGCLYISRIESEIIEQFNSQEIVPEIMSFVTLCGLQVQKIQDFLPYDFSSFDETGFSFAYRYVEDGDILTVGDYHFECITAPGHSKGHVCLYDSDKKILVAGDHLFKDIVSGIQARKDVDNPLGDYLESLAKICKLDPLAILPGHGDAFTDISTRIRKVEAYHECRAQQVLHIIEKGWKTSYQVASQMTRNGQPIFQEPTSLLLRFFATAEAFAYLRYLESKGMARRYLHGQVAMFSTI